MRDDRQDDHFVKTLQEEVTHLRAALKDCQTAMFNAGVLAGEMLVQHTKELEAQKETIDEYEHLFELERESDQRACAWWRAEDPEGRALMLPDKTRLTMWLVKREARLWEEIKNRAPALERALRKVMEGKGDENAS